MTLKRLRRARSSRVVAKALCALLLMPHLLLWTEAPAPAQRKSLTVVVMDFNNRSAIPSPLLGRRAASAVSLQLRQSDNWDPVSQSVVDQKVSDLRLRPPFDRVGLQTLARAVDAQAVLMGEVTSARVTEKPAQATVRIVIQLMDVASGELINGAVATAVASHIGLDNAQDVLLDEALSKAAFEARQSMERYQLPEGTVLNTTVVGTRQDALLNIGTRQGVKAGMQFVVLRGREVVGYLSASTIDPDKTVAAVTQNFRGVKPEDMARAIYTLPPGADVADTGDVQGQQPKPGDVVAPGAIPTSKAPRRGHGLGGAARVFLGLAAVLGIYALAGSKSGANTAYSISAQSTEVSTSSNGAGVRVTWQRPHEISPDAVVQYQVYRIDPGLGAPVLIGIAFDANREVIDTADPGSVNNFYTGTGGDAGSVQTTAQMFPGLVPGKQYRYYIQTIYQQGVSFGGDTTTGTTTGTTTTGTTTGTTGGTGLLISQPSRRTGSVTPLIPPTTSSPADQSTGVDLTNVTFTWTTVAGADTYSVQVSADPTNPNSYQEVTRYLNPSKSGSQSVSRTVNIAARFAGRTLLAWRVGAKNSQDVRPPVGGYVFSNVQSFTPS